MPGREKIFRDITKAKLAGQMHYRFMVSIKWLVMFELAKEALQLFMEQLIVPIQKKKTLPAELKQKTQIAFPLFCWRESKTKRMQYTNVNYSSIWYRCCAFWFFLTIAMRTRAQLAETWSSVWWSACHLGATKTKFTRHRKVSKLFTKTLEVFRIADMVENDLVVCLECAAAKSRDFSIFRRVRTPDRQKGFDNFLAPAVRHRVHKGSMNTERDISSRELHKTTIPIPFSPPSAGILQERHQVLLFCCSVYSDITPKYLASHPRFAHKKTSAVQCRSYLR